MKRIWLLLLALALTGCCSDLTALAQVMQERQITSCLAVSGAYGLFASGTLLTATGGATLEQCRALR